MKSTNLELWEILADTLECIVSKMEYSQFPNTLCRTQFDSVTIPPITIYDYLKRINSFTQCSKSCYIIALIYIDRIIQNNPYFRLSNKNIHRVLFISILISIKFFDYVYADNYFYSKVGGMPLSEINQLELELLRLLNFKTFIDPSLYFQYFRSRVCFTLFKRIIIYRYCRVFM